MSEVEKERMLRNEVFQALVARELEGWLNKLCRDLGDILKASGIAKAKGIELDKAPSRVSVKDARRLILSEIPEAVKTLVIKYVSEEVSGPRPAASSSSLDM
jgi:argonaute-like protein implicated in RNA metabolism and viral defense